MFKRRLVSIINPSMQLPFVGVLLLFLALYTVGAAWVSYSLIKPLITTLTHLAGMESGAKTSIAETYRSLLIVLGLAFSVTFLVAGAAMIILSHRVAGAAYAINRHLENTFLKGIYDKPIALRESDYLTDIASSLNTLGANLSKQS
jgi:hypothetical protein